MVAPVKKLTAANRFDTCSVNVMAPFLLVQGMLKELEAASGAVVNIGSIHARQTKAGFSAYATSKAALVGLTRSLAVELGGRVRVNAVCPAAVATPMLSAGFAGDQKKLAALADCHPNRSIGTPEDVAAYVLILASGASPYVTGVILNLDGGVSSKLFEPSVSDDNPYSESLFHTLKYTPAYPGKPFESLEAARRWVHAFVQWYNHAHRHSAIRFVTPHQRHSGQEHELLARRATVYEAARQRHPERWSGKTRNWNPVAEVWLNPPKEHQPDKKQDLKVACSIDATTLLTNSVTRVDKYQNWANFWILLQIT